MIRKKKGVMLCFVLGIAQGVTAQIIEHSGTRVEFNKKVAELSKDKLVVVDLYTKPCSGCTSIASAIKKLQTSLGGQVDFVKVYVKGKHGNDFIRHYKITSVPRILIFKNGSKVADFVPQSSNQFTSKIKVHL